MMTHMTRIPYLSSTVTHILGVFVCIFNIFVQSLSWTSMHSLSFIRVANSNKITSLSYIEVVRINMVTLMNQRNVSYKDKISPLPRLPNHFHHYSSQIPIDVFMPTQLPQFSINFPYYQCKQTCADTLSIQIAQQSDPMVLWKEKKVQSKLHIYTIGNTCLKLNDVDVNQGFQGTQGSFRHRDNKNKTYVVKSPLIGIGMALQQPPSMCH